MSKNSFRRRDIDGHRLHPATQMVSFGYEPSMSEGAVKPPVFLTSTFAFQSAEEGADFFDVVAGRKPAPEDGGAGGLVYSRFNHPNTEIVEDRLALFDGADPNVSTARRELTTVPTQSLFLMNNEFVHEQAWRFAKRLVAESDREATRIESAYRMTLGRAADDEERMDASSFLADYREALAQTEQLAERRDLAAWAGFARTLLTRNEFLFVD